MRSTAYRALGLLVFTALLACGDGGGDSQTGTANNAATLGGGPPGGTLVVLADREPDQLNPLTFNSVPAYQAVHLMFRALALRDSTLSGYKPDLAKAWRLESDSSVILELRNDVNWHDGKRVTAEDVVFTIEQQRNPETASPRKADVAAVTSVTARDSFTVEVKLGRTGLYTVNALLEVVPVPKHLLQGIEPARLRDAPFNRAPVGNGFYRFVSWTAGQSLTMQVNPDKPDGRAAIERIVMRFLPDANSALTELLTGNGDLIPKLAPAMKARVDQSNSAKVYDGPRVRPAWIAWNTKRPPFDDARVRRALLMAIDRPTLAKLLFGDIGEPALSPIPTPLREHAANVRTIAYDTTGARALLAEAGWRDSNADGILDRNGQPLRFELEFISGDQTRQDMLVAMQSMLRKIGVDMAPRAYESTTWVSRLRAGDFAGSFWGWGWGPGVMGPNAEMIFDSKSAPPNGPNFARYSNPRVDQLLDSVLVTTDTARSRVLWSALEQILIDDVAYAPIYMDPELFGVHSRFRNVRMRGIEWWEDVPYWYVEPAEALPRDKVRS
jgi:peptide/nickel transport system substrate-binding protein